MILALHGLCLLPGTSVLKLFKSHLVPCFNKYTTYSTCVANPKGCVSKEDSKDKTQIMNEVHILHRIVYKQLKVEHFVIHFKVIFCICINHDIISTIIQ